MICRTVRLVGKGGAEPVPDFSLVQVVGCLGRRDDAWMLTNTTEPVRTGDPRPAAERTRGRENDLKGYGYLPAAGFASLRPRQP